VTSNAAVIGDATDSTIVHFLAECAAAGRKPRVLSLGDITATGGWHLAVPDDGSSRVWTADAEVPLSDVGAFYCRLTGSRAQWARDKEIRESGLLRSLRLWLTASRALVINRPDIDQHNGSKSLHEAELARLGFSVPESITSSDISQLADFLGGGRAVIKTCSGVRADTRELHADRLREYTADRGPLHLQRLIPGHDIRAHVVGTEVLAIRIDSDEAVDYRTDRSARYHAVAVPRELQALLVEATRAQGMVFSGWDLKVDADERVWCLESNPMPGYSFYDRHLDGEISKALMRKMWG
jgi:glutathione synthase/RimK-type ligase-like ATP-grasp enzyme